LIRNSCTTFYEEYSSDGGIFTKENKNLYIIDKKSGQSLKKFGNIMKKKQVIFPKFTGSEFQMI